MGTNYKTKGLAEQATLKLRDFILKGKFKPGDLLPAEIELSEELGVSRTIMREALSRFRMMGIIDSRRRRGMILQNPDFLNGMELAMSGSWLQESDLKDMFEFRLMLEIGLADFIFNNNREALIKKLDRIVAKEKECSSDLERMKYDAQFHSALYTATGNRSLVRIQKMLHPLFIRYASKKAGQPGNTEVGHADLLQVIKIGNADAFREAMRRHLEPHFKIQEEKSE
jgi:DNA-binding FadR family transcriptional regulator